jgi:Dolichyl-phosphate-mannose-protein mannosyltransferase
VTAAAPAFARASPGRQTSAARLLVTLVLAACVLLGLALAVLSVVPSAQLTNRLLGATGEARAGANTQELATYLDVRLRLAAGLVLALAGGLVLVRSGFEELLAAAFDGFRSWLTGLSRSSPLLAGVPTLAALVMRIPFLSQPMRYDEALTFNEFASRPVYYGLSFYPDPNNHLLNTLLMHLAFVGLGNQPWVLRLPAFLAGVLLVPATFPLARSFYGERAAALAAVLVAVSSYLVEYSTNARGYTLQSLCFVVLMWLVVVAAQRHSRSALLAAALVGALGAYALPTMLYGVVIAALWLLLARRWPKVAGLEARTVADQPDVRPRHLAASGLLLGLVVVLLYLPVLVISGADKIVSNRFVVALDRTEVVPELLRSLARTWAFWNRDIPWPLAALLVIGFGITVAFEVRSKRVPLGLLAPLVCLVLVLAQRVAPFERVWLFLLPLYFTVAAAGLARFVDGRLLAAAFGVVLGYLTLTSGSILASAETGAFPEAEAVTRALAPRLAPDDAVVTQLPASLPQLQYYFPRFGLSTNVLVRPPDQGQNLWVIAAPDSPPSVNGFPTVVEVERFSDATLYELRRP